MELQSDVSSAQISSARLGSAQLSLQPASAGFLLRLLFDPKDGGDMLL
jgi:hypothetical protein